MAVLDTQDMAELGEWNTVTIHRRDWNGWIQLNDGPQIAGKSAVRLKFLIYNILVALLQCAPWGGTDMNTL